jgi:hypothetical protein
MSLTIDHITYTIDPLPDEFEPIKRLWHFFKLGPRNESSYNHTVIETLYLYYQQQGCVYKTHHSIKR